ncbi:MAG: ATP-dependent helicase HrpB [Bacteroidota bacterium]|nr:ATP-dependent helicase HrpB [Bacteroidota bacterium]
MSKSSFNPYTFSLPVVEILDQVKSHLEQSNTLLVQAPPGAGKSTILPLALLDEPWLQGKKIIVLEPRRLATRSIAYRLAELLGEEIGDTVGFRIRFENRVGTNNKIIVVTEGILTRMLQSDNALEDVGLVIFDEFHERSIHADLSLALCRESQQILRPDLRILIMSATLNASSINERLKAPVLTSEGKQYPVDIFYSGETDLRLLPETVSRLIIEASKKHEGDILVFLPGEAEIRKTAELLKQETRQFNVHPLYGMLPQHEQYLAIMPNKSGKRKVVLATSIAETSLTIEGVKVVIDTGFSRMQRFDPKSGLSKLETVQISKDSADQRAGRAGRLSAGVCYRMWTPATQARLQEHRVPEILEADLASLLLDLFVWGVQDIHQLYWISQPPAAHVAQALDVLEQIGAVENAKLTDHGKQIHQLACHPRIAHMLLLAPDLASKQLACDVAAVLEERDPLNREAGIDINLRVEALRRARKNNALGKSFSRIEKVAESYRKLLSIEASNEAYDAFETGLLLAHAYPERIACARVGNNAQFQLANGKIAAAGHKDDLAHEPWLAVASMDTREGLGKIFMAAPLNPVDLKSLVKMVEVVTWDTRKGGIMASTDLRIGSIILQSKPMANPSLERVQQAICKAIKQEGRSLLNFSEEFVQFQNRVLSLGIWNPEQEWPTIQTDYLLQTPEEWLLPFLNGIKRNEDLKKIDLVQAVIHKIPYSMQVELLRLAPDKIEVPSGSHIAIQYFERGETPVLAVRLQEVFGMPDTPKINDGKTALVLHLLSPGFKPVQVTSDLRSFWDNTYHEVKKELQRRYPKHSWPDNPWLAVPVAKGGRRK